MIQNKREESVVGDVQWGKLGRWNGCDCDTWKPCVTKMENGKKKRILSNGKCDQFVEENKTQKEKKGRKKRRNSSWKGRKERNERK